MLSVLRGKDTQKNGIRTQWRTNFILKCTYRVGLSVYIV